MLRTICTYLVSTFLEFLIQKAKAQLNQTVSLPYLLETDLAAVALALAQVGAHGSIGKGIGLFCECVGI